MRLPPVPYPGSRNGGCRTSQTPKATSSSSVAAAEGCRAAGARGFPVTTEKEKTMIFHINRMTFKAGLSKEQLRAAVELLRQAGAANPAVKSYVVGPELGGEFKYGAVYVVEDLDGYWAYLTHPAHVRSELEGIPLIEKFAAIDVSDSDDPDLAEKIAALQARNFREHPEVAAAVAQAASFTVPDGSRSPATKGSN